MLPKTPIHASEQNRSLLPYYQRQGYGHPNLHKDLQLMSNPSRDFPIYKSKHSTNHIMSIEKQADPVHNLLYHVNQQLVFNSQATISLQKLTIHYIMSRDNCVLYLYNKITNYKRKICPSDIKKHARLLNFAIHYLIYMCIQATFPSTEKCWQDHSEPNIYKMLRTTNPQGRRTNG